MKQRRREHGRKPPRHESPTQPLPRPGDRRPRDDAADPGRRGERHEPRQPAEQPDEERAAYPSIPGTGRPCTTSDSKSASAGRGNAIRSRAAARRPSATKKTATMSSTSTRHCPQPDLACERQRAFVVSWQSLVQSMRLDYSASLIGFAVVGIDDCLRAHLLLDPPRAYHREHNHSTSLDVNTHGGTNTNSRPTTARSRRRRRDPGARRPERAHGPADRGDGLLGHVSVRRGVFGRRRRHARYRPVHAHRAGAAGSVSDRPGRSFP